MTQAYEMLKPATSIMKEVRVYFLSCECNEFSVLCVSFLYYKQLAFWLLHRNVFLLTERKASHIPVEVLVDALTINIKVNGKEVSYVAQHRVRHLVRGK